MNRRLHAVGRCRTGRSTIVLALAANRFESMPVAIGGDQHREIALFLDHERRPFEPRKLPIARFVARNIAIPQEDMQRAAAVEALPIRDDELNVLCRKIPLRLANDSVGGYS